MVDVLKPEFFIVAPEEGSEHYQHPVPQLKEGKVKRCYAHHGKAENIYGCLMGVWTAVMARTKNDWTFVHIFFPVGNSSGSDVGIITSRTGWIFFSSCRIQKPLCTAVSLLNWIPPLSFPTA